MGPFVVLAGILILYLILGCVMDTMSMILLTIPIFFPLIMGGWTSRPGSDREGHLVRHPRTDGGGDRRDHPPVGMNVYVISSMWP